MQKIKTITGTIPLHRTRLYNSFPFFIVIISSFTFQTRNSCPCDGANHINHESQWTNWYYCILELSVGSKMLSAQQWWYHDYQMLPMDNSVDFDIISVTIAKSK